MLNEAPLSDYENGLRIFARMIARAYRQELAETRLANTKLANTMGKDANQTIQSEQDAQVSPGNCKTAKKEGLEKNLEIGGGNGG